MKNPGFMIKIASVLLLAAVSCSEDDSIPAWPSVPVTGEWDIPIDEIFDGGVGIDGIPALSNPDFIGAPTAFYLEDDDLVLGYKNGAHIRAYPHRILNWHEIINDKISDHAFTINYCPLTGTGIGWERVLNDEETTFGVSGLLYNSNLILYDRKTKSRWSQMKLAGVHGELRGKTIDTHQLVETTWGSWKSMFPNTIVLSSLTGHSRNYGRNPYGDYIENHDLIIFPYQPEDNRLDNKERVHGVIIEGEAKAYRFDSFSDRLTIIDDNFRGVPLVVAGSRSDNFIVSYKRILPDGAALEFQLPPDDSPLSIILTDEEGNLWDIFGVAVSGPRQGQRLTPTTSFMGFWFAWGAFYPELEIYKE